MAESDFGFFGASAADTKRGVSAGFTPPNGGGSFVFGFNSQLAQAKSSGVYYDATNFAPLRDDSSNATGGSVRGDPDATTILSTSSSTYTSIPMEMLY
jgi:hypothetical protein